ncbi:MAG: hypothetical protein FJ088_16485 [Deltaproteobacteria bacterium]|nr:hypothetical protein [Deltaproteobacteria bacterium]
MNLATLLNFAAHPETLWGENHYISADYPGAFRNRVVELGGGVPLFFSGALGGMVTANVNPKGSQEERRQYVKFMGHTLAETAVSALESAEKIAEPVIAFRKKPVYFPMKNWRFRLARRLKIFERDFTDGYVKSEINFVSIGDLHILTAPGECTPETGRLILARMSGWNNMLFCLGCDEIGYILTGEQWANREYCYETTMSLGMDTAGILINECGVLLKV